jgi:hypothetical protein
MVGINNCMNHGNDSPHRENSQKKGPRGISWPVKAILFAVVGLIAIFSHAMNGWGEPVAMAVAALILPVFLRQFRKFWSQRRFWITVSLLAVIQVPLVIAVRLPIQQAGRLYSLEFGIIDVLFVGFVIIFVCSRSSGERN